MEEIDTHPLACDCGGRTHSHWFSVVRYPYKVTLKCQVCGKERAPVDFCEEQGCSAGECKQWSEVCPVFVLLPEVPKPWAAYKKFVEYLCFKKRVDLFAGYWEDEGWYGLLINFEIFGLNLFLHCFFWPVCKLNLSSVGWKERWVLSLTPRGIDFLN